MIVIQRVVIKGDMPATCNECLLCRTGMFNYKSCGIFTTQVNGDDKPTWCPLEVETDEPKYKLARGVLNWKEGDESAVDAIRRLRDSEDTFNLLPEAPKEVKQ